VAGCSGLLTLPVVEINKGSCKTLACWRAPCLLCLPCLLHNGLGGIYFPPMLLLCFPQKKELSLR